MRYMSFDPPWEVYIMTLHHVVWRAQDACKFTIAGEGSESFTVTATPVVTSYWFGTTVGVLARTHDSFGYWMSSNICSPIAAWRIAQILPRVKTIRNHGGGYDETLCGLVIALGSDRHEDRMRERAKDLGVTTDELITLLDQINEMWPTTADLCSMWDQLSDKQQDGLARTLRDALSAGQIGESRELINRIETAELRLRNAAEQREHEEGLIAAGLKPEASLRQLLLDIGVTNLAYTVGYGDFGEPSHFAFGNLDHEIMRELIGQNGFCSRVPLITTAKEPDDPSAHRTSGGGEVTMFWNDFGDSGHPRIILQGEAQELTSIGWDRVTERFILTVHPRDMEKDDSRDQSMSIEDLRAMIGQETGLDGPLIPGERPRWLKKPGLLAGLVSFLTKP